MFINKLLLFFLLSRFNKILKSKPKPKQYVFCHEVCIFNYSELHFRIKIGQICDPNTITKKLEYTSPDYIQPWGSVCQKWVINSAITVQVANSVIEKF